MAISDKAAAQEILDHLPDDASLEDIMYALYVRQKIERGLRDAEDGNLIAHEDVKREINEWLRSTGQQ
jgi:predicted transcriptional regulator